MTPARSRWRVGIDDRLARIPRYRAALLHSMAEFGDDFDLESFVAAYDATDPDAINAVTAVEGDLGHIVNWLRQVGELGYHELVRLGRIEKSDDGPLESLVEAGVLTAADRSRLTDLVRLRNRLQHDYPGVTPAQIHATVGMLLEMLPRLIERYVAMIERIDA